MDEILGTLAGRYRLTRLLGRGATSDVFEAHDLSLGAVVALKRFRTDSLDGLLRLKTEFRALADVHEPGLVRLYDLVVADDAAFFTMELVDGVGLAAHARTASLDDTLRVLGAIAEAIAALHRRRILHRDLKPANILVVRDGSVRILDFGLAGKLGGTTAGTPAYMAPELFEGGAPSPASDWYAFGTLAYEALTQRPPATGPLAELVLRKRTRRFPPPGEVDGRIPAHVGALVWALLDPAPARRPGADAIAAAIAPASPVVPPPARTELFGRARELAWLDDKLASAASGRAAIVVIEGESGLGKSSLVRAFLDREAARGWVVLKSAARPQESLPMRAIDAIVDELVDVIRAVPAIERAALVAQLPRSLVRSFPVLGLFDGAAREDQPGADVLEARREAQAAFGALLARICERTPVVLWVDDLQWADPESLQLLERIAATASASRLLIVLGRRPVVLPWPAHEAWLASLDRIALAPLDDRDARALLDAHTRDRPLSAAAAETAMREAQGNAFLLELLARHAARDGEGAGLASALRHVLDRLDADTRVLFECISLTQHPLPLACVGRVLADRAALRGHVARLATDGLISVDELERVRPYHDVLRARADEALAAPARRARHQALAVALDELAMPIEWQIPHLEGAGQHDAAGRASLVAGQTAAARHAFEIAATYYAKALALGALDTAERAATLEALADNLAAAGHGRDASVHYRDAAALVGDPQRALAMHHKQAIALLRTGAVADGRTALAAVLRRIGERLPRRPVLAALYEAIRVAVMSRRPSAGALSPALGMQLDALWTSANSLSMYDPLVGNALTLRFVRRALAAGEPRWAIRALALEAAFLAALGGRMRGRARQRMIELRTRIADRAWPYEAAWVAATEGSTAWLSGDVRGCLDWITRARDLFRALPETNAHELALLDSFRLPALALVGDHDIVLRAADEVIAVSRARGDGFAALPCLHGHITAAYLATGQLALAHARADEARAIGSGADSPIPAYHQAWSRATLALFEGDGERAERVMRDAWPRLRRSGMLRLEAVVGDLRYLRGRCALAAAKQRRGAGVRDAAAQARWLRGSTLAYGAAAADALDAQLAWLARGEGIVNAHATAAIAAFDALGLAPERDALARKVRREPPWRVDQVHVVV